MALISKNLGFYYNKDKWLFRAMDFELKPGEIVGISGCSGCGKTSFARVLANYVKPIEGEVLVDGEGFKKNKHNAVQLIHQHPEKAIDPKWKMKNILEESFVPDEKLLEKFGIREEWYNRYSIELSGGEQQRFCIVRALNPETKYIIADEITTMLDGITQASIWKELIAICQEKKIGLLIVSHERAILEKLCSRIIEFEETNACIDAGV